MLLKFNQGRHDQGAFNYLHLSGTLTKNGVNVAGQPKNEEVRHMAFIPCINRTLGYIKSINSNETYATVIHHYYTDLKLRNTIPIYCPKEYDELEDYLCEKEYFFK